LIFPLLSSVAPWSIVAPVVMVPLPETESRPPARTPPAAGDNVSDTSLALVPLTAIEPALTTAFLPILVSTVGLRFTVPNIRPIAIGPSAPPSTPSDAASTLSSAVTVTDPVAVTVAPLPISAYVSPPSVTLT
jgi:hypothetical protein